MLATTEPSDVGGTVGRVVSQASDSLPLLTALVGTLCLCVIGYVFAAHVLPRWSAYKEKRDTAEAARHSAILQIKEQETTQAMALERGTQNALQLTANLITLTDRLDLGLKKLDQIYVVSREKMGSCGATKG